MSTKRKSPWQPIEGAPKDGTTLFLRKGDECWVGRYLSATECWSVNDGVNTLRDPTHYMLIPKLEVE